MKRTPKGVLFSLAEKERFELFFLTFAGYSCYNQPEVINMNYTIIKITDEPSMKDRAADWFNQKWGIPREAYEESMYAALSDDCAVPEWYIASCKKIKYMFPKAHAAAYVMSAIRLAWYKVHQPVAFYCAILSVAPDGFDGTIIAQGRDAVYRKMLEIDKMGKEATAKDKDTFGALQFAHEAMLRGVRFLPVSLKHSDAREFLPENGNIRMPMIALPGLGLNAALNITNARDEQPFFSIEDLKLRGKANKGVIDTLRANGILDGLSETDQISLFDII